MWFLKPRALIPIQKIKIKLNDHVGCQFKGHDQGKTLLSMMYIQMLIAG